MVRLVARLLCGMVVALAACNGALAAGASAPAQAATTWQVVVGGDSQDGAVTANSFLPASITINAGDQVTWMFRGFHTVSFLSGGERPQIAVPAGEGDRLMFNPAIFLPAGGPSYDGAGFANSGIPDEQHPTFALTFTKPGTYGYVCLVHPGQAGTVVVQAADSAYPMTQAQVDAQGNAQFYSKLQHGTDLIASAKLTSTPGSNGATNYNVTNGIGGEEASVIRFLPREVTVKAGDSVTWTMRDPHELHTVTFYDTTGTAPDIIEPQPQANGPPKLLLRYITPSGGTAVEDPKGFYNSGLLAPGQSYTFSFPKPGTYNYICAIHGAIQTGTVTVEGAGAAAPGGAQPPASLPNTADGAQSAPLLPLAAGAMLLILLGIFIVRRRTTTE